MRYRNNLRMMSPPWTDACRTAANDIAVYSRSPRTKLVQLASDLDRSGLSWASSTTNHLIVFGGNSRRWAVYCKAAVIRMRGEWARTMLDHSTLARQSGTVPFVCRMGWGSAVVLGVPNERASETPSAHYREPLALVACMASFRSPPILGKRQLDVSVSETAT